MKLILVSKTNEKWISEGIEKFYNRIKHYHTLEIITVNDKNKGKTEPEICKKSEGELILSRIKEKDFVCLLDENGTHFTSIKFSEWLNKELFLNNRPIVFVIGGAFGFSPAVYSRANCQISLSAMTCSHQVIRLFFMEQLYRAFTILNNEPYHHT